MEGFVYNKRSILERFDEVPTANSKNAVESGGVKTATDQLNDLVLIQDEQPVSSSNKIWISDDPGESIEVPTMGDVHNIVAPEYDSTQSYNLDDYTLHSDLLYRKTSGSKSASEWNSNHWTETSVGEELSRNNVKLVSIGLTHALWGGEDPYYAQYFVPNPPTPVPPGGMSITPSYPLTAKTKIDVQPTVDQISSMISDGITALTVVNNLASENDKWIRLYAFGGKPSFTSLQCTLTEVI